MIERYTRPEMGKIWTPENRYQAWLRVELAVCEAWSPSVIPMVLPSNPIFSDSPSTDSIYSAIVGTPGSPIFCRRIPLP